MGDAVGGSVTGLSVVALVELVVGTSVTTGCVGAVVGLVVVDVAVGLPVGDVVVAATVGLAVGDWVGFVVGLAVGLAVGGDPVGLGVAPLVGLAVGASVATTNVAYKAQKVSRLTKQCSSSVVLMSSINLLASPARKTQCGSPPRHQFPVQALFSALEKSSASNPSSHCSNGMPSNASMRSWS